MFRALRSLQLAIVFLGLTSAAAAAAEPNWIWSADNALDKEPLGTRYFRREFKLGANPITRAEVEITADDEYELFINGQLIGRGNKWQQFDRYDIKPLLTDGPNVIAAAAINRGGQAGLVAHVKIEMQNLPTVEFATDHQWLANSLEAYGWNRVRFDAAAWKPAHVYGPLGTTAPWGKVAAAGQVVSAPPPHVRKSTRSPAGEVRRSSCDGDRVVLLGNTLIEREQKYGYLETALTERYPDRNITFRNLGWSGDTVWGEARAVFGTQADGFRALKEHVLALKPTVIFVGYGTNESFAGEAGLPHFIDGLNTLLDTLDETDARIIMLSPLRMEKLGPPLPDPEQQNKNLELYSKALGKVAGERSCNFVDLFNTLITSTDIAKWAGDGHLTNDELHLTERGYSRFAEVVETALLGPPAGPRLSKGQTEELRGAIIHKNELYFNRWRPANVTYLFLFRRNEQGQNAVEIPKFDPLIAEAEQQIARLRVPKLHVYELKPVEENSK